MAGSGDGGRVVELTIVQTRSEAELLVSVLRAEGLRAMSSADDAGGWGLNVGIEGVRILVLEDDLAAARLVVARSGDGPVPGGGASGAGSRPRPRKRRPGSG